MVTGNSNVKTVEKVSTSDRTQMEMVYLNAQIEPDHPARFIDAFVDKRDWEQLGFQLKALKNEGRPVFHPAMLLENGTVQIANK